MKVGEEENNLSVNASGRRSMRGPTFSGNQKRITDVSKKIENVEYLIKIEQKNKKQLEEKYTKTINKLESQIEKLERELENTLKELNEKEAKIFDIQKNKLDVFKVEIQKYENVYSEIEEKFSSVNSQLEDSNVDENILYNQSNMIYEDYLSYNHEIVMLKKQVDECKENLKEIEKTYPKEFSFLLEDIHMEKDLNEIQVHKKQFQKEIDQLEKTKRELYKVKEMKQNEIKNNIEEIKKIESSIELTRNDSHISKMEDYIMNNINDMLVFEKMKILVQNYYNQKNFDLENDLNVKLINNLNEKLKEMKNEFVNIKNEKFLNKAKLEKMLDEMTKIFNNNKNSVDRVRVEKEIKSRQTELDRINNEINILELNCKKKETLFNKYIIVLRNKCKKSAQESYYEMNPTLVLETEFEDKFKDEILKTIDDDSRFSEKEKIKNKNIIEIYFKELITREKNLQNYLIKKKKTEENLENVNKDIYKIDENIQINENEITNKKSSINELLMKEKIFSDKIQSRNINLSKKMELLGEVEFEKYMKSNDQILKNMKKVYGNKVLDKVFKVQKQKFMEGVIMDHSFKKGKVNENIQIMTKSENLQETYNLNLNELENNYNSKMQIYNQVIQFRENKLKEKQVLEESKTDLKDNIGIIMSNHIKEIETDKKHLQFKFNINYYFEKIKELTNKINLLKKEGDSYQCEYNNFSQIINEKEKKLYIEDLDLKNNFISLSMRGNEDNLQKTVMPYKVNNMSKSYEYTNEDDDENKNQIEENFTDILKKSVQEFNNSQYDNLLMKEEINLEEIKNEDQMKNSFKDLENNISNDPLFNLMIDKIKPFVSGFNLYKKFSSSSLNGKVFDPLQADQNTPESCGYTIRMFKINPILGVLEIRNPKNKHVENKFNISDLKGILLGGVAKNLVKQKKSNSGKPNQEVNKLLIADYIPFNLNYLDGKMDLIAPTYQIFHAFESALDELLKNSKNLKNILKYLDE